MATDSDDTGSRLVTKRVNCLRNTQNRHPIVRPWASSEVTALTNIIRRFAEWPIQWCLCRYVDNTMLSWCNSGVIITWYMVCVVRFLFIVLLLFRGNYQGTSPYSTDGAPCSKCANPSCCSDAGLCQGQGSEFSLWRHYMKTLSASLALCEGNPPVIRGFPAKGQKFRALFFLCCKPVQVIAIIGRTKERQLTPKGQ